MSNELRVPIKSKIASFTDLYVWQEGHKLVVNIYLVTKNFPDEEKFGLTSQIRRSSVSITSNIAEGFGRSTYKDRLHFYFVSQGSLSELKNQLLIARYVGYLSSDNFSILANQSNKVHELLQGFIKKTKSFINS